MNFNKCSDEELILYYRNTKDDTREEAIEVLFERYKNLVRKKAAMMYIEGGENEDLIQEGMIGLYKAVMNYDESKEASFATFATMCITRKIMSAVTASKALKNVPLNTYLSFDAPVGEGGDSDGDVRLLDMLHPANEQNPENLFFNKENKNSMEQKLRLSLSSLEKQVFELYLQGKDYKEIALYLKKTPKSIDNALQRIRAKAVGLS